MNYYQIGQERAFAKLGMPLDPQKMRALQHNWFKAKQGKSRSALDAADYDLNMAQDMQAQVARYGQTPPSGHGTLEALAKSQGRVVPPNVPRDPGTLHPVARPEGMPPTIGELRRGIYR